MMKRKSTANSTTTSNSSSIPNKRPATEITPRSTPNPEWTKTFTAGREAFKNKQYKEACDSFTRALDFDCNRLEVLDCRGVTYTLLNDQDLAATDFMAMIKISPNRSRGYLRLGKQLVERNMLDQAVKVYERASAKVDQSDTHYETLMKALLKTRIVRDDKKNARDFMKILPFEIVCQILSYLPFTQKVRCMRVCKTWHGFGLNWSGMWSDLDFGRRLVPSATLVKYFSYATGRHIRKLSIKDKQSKIEKVFKLLIHYDAHYIESLSLSGSEIPGIHLLRMLRLVGKNLTHLRLDSCQMHIEDLFNNTLSNCRHLTHLSYFGYDENVSGEMPIFDIPSSLSPLKHLQLACTKPGDNTGAHIHSILRMFSDLEVFILYGSEDNINRTLHTVQTTCPHLSVFQFKRRWDRRLLAWRAIDMNMATGKATGKKTGGMKEISLIGAHELRDSGIIPLIQIHTDTLETLEIAGCGNNTNQVFSMLISPGLPQLRKLNLNSCLALGESDLRDLIQKCVLLEDLELAMVSAVTDSVLECVAVHPVINKIDISSCVNVTGSGVRQIVDIKGGDVLKKLRVVDCRGVSWDEIEYASTVVKPNVLEYRQIISK
ncbi:hypothetical protein J3Q64DRAFT_1773274 [Phycomyces blakesleeanus]|uniref:F-box domain-containing protein n=2 Tax=Phycomyces blakesleeanus TaxID=4837 RepID=A0A163DVB9_PHYB8|nr:hypothetical protein PHYBLDRAFT_168076 [Phycomyces blakesleeanus NRRL 1555(-)]OAD73640.1 hypothetical protein PHYBLDRAFT_168076 [Phycomyces blakesleeanus NRRL 1555(-)]|eukprot:XP_018291680.1 hypothetical protein PHYBLDRAFT_168076 [Phycomyces blakesleeanus NRRL 1555(-)]